MILIPVPMISLNSSTSLIEAKLVRYIGLRQQEGEEGCLDRCDPTCDGSQD
ncbi:hypothetical protein ACPOL_6621 [Acidisarcina polymorpha]|uniref:Uncharacterized protein n=1 Tax=Acidisarcina polymorpha TaxID=2211140 RepID=A0A2Z5G9A2_9BACT|nr:hypothetical protein ACPOL_6621 [Acidisarcina polymorpha]